MASLIVGYLPNGPKTELKFSLEYFWDGSAADLQKVAADLRESIWNSSVEYFIVPELGPDVKFSYASHKAVTEYKEAKALGVDTVPVLVGPVSYLLLSKPAKGVEKSFSLLSLLGKILPIYKEVITELKEAGASWIQFDEPTLVMDLESHKLHAFTEAYSALESTLSGLNVLIETCFAVKKVVEVNALGRALAGQKDEVISYANAAAQASRKSSPRGQRCGGPKLFDIKETKGDRDPIDNTEDEIGISPPAISRSPIPKTMRVKIMVNSREYIALIDTGSNLNFLHPRVAGNGGLKIIHDDPIEVRIADGSIMRSEGSCPEFKFEIQGVQFATEAYILQLDGCDVILGIQWLMGLGQIKNWDFASLKMELTQGDRTIQIKGMDTEESEVGCSTDEKLVSMVREGVKYGAGIVYDIHSPRVPSTEEIADGINMMLAVLETIQVNPDGGLKTRKYTEVKPALKNKLLRSQLVSAK